MSRIVFTSDWHHHDYSFPNTSERLLRCIKSFRCFLNYVERDNWFLLGDFFHKANPSYNLMNLLFDVLQKFDRMCGSCISGNHDQVTHDYLSPLKTLSFSDKLFVKYRCDPERDNIIYYDGHKILTIPFCRKAVDFLAVLKVELRRRVLQGAFKEPLIIACHQYFENIAPFEGSEVIKLDAIEQVIQETGFKHKVYFVSGHLHLRSYKDYGNFEIIYPGCAIDNNFGEVDYPVGGVNLITEGEDVYFEFFDFNQMYEDADIGRFKIVDVNHLFDAEITLVSKHYYRVDIPSETALSQVEAYKKQLQKYKNAGWHIQENFTRSKKSKEQISKVPIALLENDAMIKMVVDELSVPADYDQDVLIAKGKELIL